MSLNADVVADLNVALNEAEVAGLQVDVAAGRVRVLLHVLALPAEGPLESDTRRAVTLSGVSEARVLLRRDRQGNDPYGPPIALLDLAELDRLFASLAFRHPMYGWKFLDEPSLTEDWPATESLLLRLREDHGEHLFYWFSECGRLEAGEMSNYCLEGTVRFDDLSVERFDGTVIPIGEFIAAARRWWSGLHSGDLRVSVEAQRAVAAPPPWPR